MLRVIFRLHSGQCHIQLHIDILQLFRQLLLSLQNLILMAAVFLSQTAEHIRKRILCGMDRCSERFILLLPFSAKGIQRSGKSVINILQIFSHHLKSFFVVLLCLAQSGADLLVHGFQPVRQLCVLR